MRAVIEALLTCVTREGCDALATNFCLVASKAARRRMVRPRDQDRLEAVALRDGGTAAMGTTLVFTQSVNS